MEKVCGLDVYKDSIFACILDNKYLLDVNMESIGIGFFIETGESTFYKTVTRSQK
jgi:hypothetical protein